VIRQLGLDCTAVPAETTIAAARGSPAAPRYATEAHRSDAASITGSNGCRLNWTVGAAWLTQQPRVLRERQMRPRVRVISHVRLQHRA
jgi:hypothetical protein